MADALAGAGVVGEALIDAALTGAVFAGAGLTTATLGMEVPVAALLAALLAPPAFTAAAPADAARALATTGWLAAVFGDIAVAAEELAARGALADGLTVVDFELTGSRAAAVLAAGLTPAALPAFALSGAALSGAALSGAALSADMFATLGFLIPTTDPPRSKRP